MEKDSRSLQRRTFSPLHSMWAGVGSFIPVSKEPNYERPSVDDPASQEAFDKYKQYSIKVEKDANKRRYYSGYFDRVSGSLLIGAFAGVGVALTGALTEVFTSTVGLGASAAIVGPVAAGVLLVGMSLAIGYVGLKSRQSVTQAAAGKEMDLEDFQSRRQASLIAKEIKSEMVKGKDTVEKPTPSAVLTAEIDDKPKTKIAQRVLGKKIDEPQEVEMAR